MTRDLTRRERDLLELLDEAVASIEFELSANGPDEIRGNPILLDKDRFCRRARRKIATLKGTRCYIQVGSRRRWFNTEHAAARVAEEINHRTGIIVGINR